MFRWKKKLNKELDEIVRAIPSEFAPAKAPTPAVRYGQKRMLRIVAMATVCILLFSGVITGFLLGGGRNSGSVILMEANSAVRLYANASGTVSGVYSENEKGDVLLADKEFASSLCGISVEDAAQKLAERAFAAGLVKEGENAVRFTVAADVKSSAKKLVNALETSVMNYYCQKGVFIPVLGRTAELENFGAAKNAAALAQQAKGPVTVAERKAASSRPDEVESNYRTTLLRYTEDIADYVFRTASGKKEALQEIDALNTAIKEDPTNKLSLPYWFFSETFEPTESLAPLMSCMKQLLADYEIRYGQTLDGTMEQYALFLALNSYYKDLDLTSLRQGMDDFLSVVKLFSGVFDPSSFLGMISTDEALKTYVESLFNGIGKLPKSVEEYVSSALDMLHRTATLALHENRAEAEKQRPALSKEVYQAKISEMANEFKNFENFWNSFQ